ncbi:hypothetical protein RCL1_002907 [Eukaryota sp. TZLM3-RCL]
MLDVYNNLLLSVWTGDLPTVTQLISDFWLDTNFRSEHEHSILTIALRLGHGDIVKFLLEKGAQLALPFDITSFDARFPIVPEAFCSRSFSTLSHIVSSATRALKSKLSLFFKSLNFFNGSLSFELTCPLEKKILTLSASEDKKIFLISLESSTDTLSLIVTNKSIYFARNANIINISQLLLLSCGPCLDDVDKITTNSVFFTSNFDCLSISPVYKKNKKEKIRELSPSKLEYNRYSFSQSFSFIYDSFEVKRSHEMSTESPIMSFADYTNNQDINTDINLNLEDTVFVFKKSPINRHKSPSSLDYAILRDVSKRELTYDCQEILKSVFLKEYKKITVESSERERSFSVGRSSFAPRAHNTDIGVLSVTNAKRADSLTSLPLAVFEMLPRFKVSCIVDAKMMDFDTNLPFHNFYESYRAFLESFFQIPFDLSPFFNLPIQHETVNHFLDIFTFLKFFQQFSCSFPFKVPLSINFDCTERTTPTFYELKTVSFQSQSDSDQFISMKTNRQFVCDPLSIVNPHFCLYQVIPTAKFSCDSDTEFSFPSSCSEGEFLEDIPGFVFDSLDSCSD